MSIKFSVVIPVYNVAPYLGECLDSLLHQTTEDFEILAVDDGSTDDSLNILQQYEVKDARIKVFRKKNGGVSSARNYGIERASGDYISFVDGDDWVSPDYLTDLFDALQDGADSSMCGFQTFNSSQQNIRSIVPSARKNETLEENLLAFYDFQKPIWQRNVWNRMYKLSVIRNNRIRFREDIHIKEDGLFVVQYLCSSNGLTGCSNRILYHYRNNPSGAIGTLMNEFNIKLMSDLLAHEALLDILSEKKVSKEIIIKAKNQAKTIGVWIDSLLLRAKCRNPWLYLKVEKKMLAILGFSDYIYWRLTQIFKKLS